MRARRETGKMALMGSNKFPARWRGQWMVVAALLLMPCMATPLYAFDFGPWDAILKKNTRPSNYSGIGYTGFDYAATLNSAEFDKLIIGLESFSPEGLHGRDDALAFWINVYNLFAVKMVRDHFPLTTIKDAGSIFSPVWGMPAGTVGGKRYSLNDIEQKILRPLNEPAIHFAIVCASVSCPDLRPEAYMASALNGQLESQIHLFLENRGKGMRVDREKKTVHLSMIFDWYEKDFAVAGGVVDFLNSARGGRQNIPPDYSVKYLRYSWDLNTVR